MSRTGEVTEKKCLICEGDIHVFYCHAPYFWTWYCSNCHESDNLEYETKEAAIAAIDGYHRYVAIQARITRLTALQTQGLRELTEEEQEKAMLAMTDYYDEFVNSHDRIGLLFSKSKGLRITPAGEVVLLLGTLSEEVINDGNTDTRRMGSKE